ncbi:MAG: hypothetical protein JAY90_05915 [Candidatus Thiodiazotropha lotti]|nr:hypothetical protein [Candidatus Thiodiazotropha lotti]
MANFPEVSFIASPLVCRLYTDGGNGLAFTKLKVQARTLLAQVDGHRGKSVMPFVSSLYSSFMASRIVHGRNIGIDRYPASASGA